MDDALFKHDQFGFQNKLSFICDDLRISPAFEKSQHSARELRNISFNDSIYIVNC